MFTTSLHGGNLNENGKFMKGKLVMRGYNNFAWGDLNQNDNFKQRT